MWNGLRTGILRGTPKEYVNVSENTSSIERQWTMTKELDKLMDMRAADYTNDDISNIITYVRKQLAMWDAGIKPKREAESSEKVQAVLAKFINAAPKAPSSGLKRRF